MSSVLSQLFEGRSQMGGRLELGSASMFCNRAWPFGDGGWTALLGSKGLGPETSRALLHPPGAPHGQPVIRLLERCSTRWLLEHSLAIWPLAHDPVLDGVDDILKPESLRIRSDHQIEGRIVGYKPLRRVVTRFDDASGNAHFYVKHVRRGHAQRLAVRHHIVAKWAASDPHLRLPTLHRMRAKPDYLVWRAARGISLRDCLASERSRWAVAAVGRCLAALHRTPTPVPEVRSRQTELSALRHWLALTRPLRERPDGLNRVLDTLTLTARLPVPAPPVLCHGDFHDGQVLLDADGTTLLDTDTLALGEAELDIGNLIAHLDLFRLARPHDATADAESSLVASYEQARRAELDARLIHWYRTLSTARLACVHSARSTTRHLEGELTQRALELQEQLLLDKGESFS